MKEIYVESVTNPLLKTQRLQGTKARGIILRILGESSQIWLAYQT